MENKINVDSILRNCEQIQKEIAKLTKQLQDYQLNIILAIDALIEKHGSVQIEPRHRFYVHDKFGCSDIVTLVTKVETKNGSCILLNQRHNSPISLEMVEGNDLLRLLQAMTKSLRKQELKIVTSCGR